MQTITVKHKIKKRKENNDAIREKIGGIEKSRSAVTAVLPVWFINNDSKNNSISGGLSK
jgi:hypothetical protein